MLKTSFFKSIHVKFVLIYILLILLAMQIMAFISLSSWKKRCAGISRIRLKTAWKSLSLAYAKK